MTGLHLLWLPILLSSVFVFIASSLIHMVTGWHNSDYPKMPGEEGFRDAVRPLAIPPGDYMVPRPTDRTDMRSPEFDQKMIQGPVMVVTVIPNGPMAMGRMMLLWFLYTTVVGFFAAYIAGRALPPEAHYLKVFQFVGASAFIGYSLSLWQMTIWYSRSWVTTLKSTVDGLIFALLTAGTFGWLWPR